MTMFPRVIKEDGLCKAVAGGQKDGRCHGAFLCFLGLLLAAPSSGAAESPPAKAADLYRTTNLWTVHLSFTAEQWTRMEPKGGGMFGRFGGPGGPPGPGGRGPGGGGFGPGMFLAP